MALFWSGVRAAILRGAGCSLAIALEVAEAKVWHVQLGVGWAATSSSGWMSSVEGDGKVEGTMIAAWPDETTSPVTALLTQRRRLRTLM